MIMLKRNIYQTTVLVALSAVIPSLGIAAQEEPGPTLRECYQLALKQSETIAIQEQVIKEAEGRFLQAFSGILPDISYEITEERREAATSSTSRKVRERRFTFNQPLFTGFKEFAAIAAGGAEKRQRHHEKRRAQELLFVDVADAFYFFLSYQDDVETLSTIREALTERVKELKERQELGRSRASEVASAQARLSRIEADLEEVKGQWEVVRQLLEFLTGRQIKNVSDDQKQVSLVLIENYLAKSDKRFDVQAAFEAWQAARKKVTVARSGFFPEVSAEGNYYEYREGTSANNDWDVTFTVDVPLFEGGENLGLMKEAKAVAAQEELRYKESKRRAELEIKNAYTNAEVTLRQESALRRAYEAADENYKLQLDDYRKNLVNNLDVLQALEDLQDMRRAWTNTQNETKRFHWNLLVASGGLHDTLGSID
ncbi:MAG TPA: TolC family protein [Candidatus Omnitrophota bacterium]|nr:TolC family protein [Candidatus Omnitrophota bacterium]